MRYSTMLPSILHESPCTMLPQGPPTFIQRSSISGQKHTVSDTLWESRGGCPVLQYLESFAVYISSDSFFSFLEHTCRQHVSLKLC